MRVMENVIIVIIQYFFLRAHKKLKIAHNCAYLSAVDLNLQ